MARPCRILASILVVASLCINFFFIFAPAPPPLPPAEPEPQPHNPDLRPNPVDRYQALHHSPIIDEAWGHVPLNRKEHAVVTVLTDDAFASAVATLGHSIHKANITARLIMLYLPEFVSQTSLCVATASGFVPQPVSRVAPPEGVNGHFAETFTKLHLWRLDQKGIKSLVYLDADTLVRRNFDELFSLPFNFAAVPDVYLDDRGFTLGFNSGIMYLRPSTAVYEDMVAKIYTADYPRWEADQAFLNIYFGNEVIRLPYAYNGNLAMKWRAGRMWKETQNEQRIVHFTLTKPFVGEGYSVIPIEDMEKHVMEVAEQSWEGAFGKEMRWWREMFSEMRQEFGEELNLCYHRSRSQWLP